MKRFAITVLLLAVTAGGAFTGSRAFAAGKFTKITVASWNIGHFALGESNDTRITQSNAGTKRLAYCKFLNDVNADILAMMEYNPNFVNATDSTAAVPAREAIAGNYRYAEIGKKESYNCNALFSNVMPWSKTVSAKYEEATEARYYICSEIILDGRKIKVVSTHLDWSNGERGVVCRAWQIKKLVDIFKNDKYVILCADWNTESSAEYGPFREAGYTMANHGLLGALATWPTGDHAVSAIDNIIVKGFAIQGVHVRQCPGLSDHALIQADLILQ